MPEKDPHVKILKSEREVFLVIDGNEYVMSPALARTLGENLFKTGTGVFKEPAEG